MESSQILILVTVFVYLVGMLVIGVYFSRRAAAAAPTISIWRPEPGPCGHRHERGGQRHEQLPADGPARPCLPLRSAGGTWTCIGLAARHLSQLAHRGPAHPPLFRPPWGHHRAGLLLPPLRRPAPRALLHRGHRDPGILYPLHRLRLQGCGHPLQQPLRL